MTITLKTLVKNVATYTLLKHYIYIMVYNCKLQPLLIFNCFDCCLACSLSPPKVKINGADQTPEYVLQMIQNPFECSVPKNCYRAPVSTYTHQREDIHRLWYSSLAFRQMYHENWQVSETLDQISSSLSTKPQHLLELNYLLLLIWWQRT